MEMIESVFDSCLACNSQHHHNKKQPLVHVFVVTMQRLAPWALLSMSLETGRQKGGQCFLCKGGEGRLIHLCTLIILA